MVQKNNILHSAAGIAISKALEPMFLEIDGEKIIIQSFAWDVEEVKYLLYLHTEPLREKKNYKEHD